MSEARSQDQCPVTSSPIRRRSARVLIALAAATGALLATGAPAQALLVEDAGGCDAQPISQVFMPWLDVANYTQVDGGTFESKQHGWYLSGDAARDQGNEPWNVAGDNGTSSLRLKPGSRAVSPTMCVGVEHPTLRLFADRNGSVLGSLAIGVRVRTSLGMIVELPLGVHTSVSGSWSATAPYVVVANLLPLLPGNYTPVEFTFTPVGSATWHIDDVYVDPWGKG